LAAARACWSVVGPDRFQFSSRLCRQRKKPWFFQHIGRQAPPLLDFKIPHDVVRVFVSAPEHHGTYLRSCRRKHLEDIINGKRRGNATQATWHQQPGAMTGTIFASQAAGWVDDSSAIPLSYDGPTGGIGMR